MVLTQCRVEMEAKKAADDYPVTKERNEFMIGEKFIAWYNKKHNACYKYVGRPQEVPDLDYEFRGQHKKLEIVQAYYNEVDAHMLWGGIRHDPNAPMGWSGSFPDQQLIESINDCIERKCRNTYGTDCSLVVHVRPSMTDMDEMASNISKIRIPHKVPFCFVYLSGFFPTALSIKADGSHRKLAREGYNCWQLHPRNEHQVTDANSPL